MHIYKIVYYFYCFALDDTGFGATTDIQKETPSPEFLATHSTIPSHAMLGNSKMVLVLILQLENLKKVIMWFYNQSIFFSI